MPRGRDTYLSEFWSELQTARIRAERIAEMLTQLDSASSAKPPYSVRKRTRDRAAWARIELENIEDWITDVMRDIGVKQ